MAEFELIQRYFSRAGSRRKDVTLGVGDDGAVLQVREAHALAVGFATLAAGSHFLPDADPETLGHQAVALSTNRLAALGAEPAWLTLALTLPEADESWMEAFSRGLDRLCTRLGMALVGGDTTRGPLAITVQAHGLVPEHESPRRGGTKSGDLVYVTGCLGLAGLAMLAQQGEIRLPAPDRAIAARSLAWPEPRVDQGIALRGLASAATDLSDGLASGLSRVLQASGVGATLQAEALPVSPLLARHLAKLGGWMLPLSAGGDCELCLTVPPEHQVALETRFGRLEVGCTWIGTVDRTPGLRCLQSDGTDIAAGFG